MTYETLHDAVMRFRNLSGIDVWKNLKKRLHVRLVRKMHRHCHIYNTVV
jgi:hypothetical protein